MTNTASKKTLTVAGHKFTLTAGRRYRASRPMGVSKNITVSIVDITEGESYDPEWAVRGMTYDGSNALINAFNAEEGDSWSGRVW